MITQKKKRLPLCEEGLPIDYPGNRPLLRSEVVSGLANIQFIFNFKNNLITETGRELAEDGLRINGSFLELMREEIRQGRVRDYSFWMDFVKYGRRQELREFTEADLDKFVAER